MCGLHGLLSDTGNGFDNVDMDVTHANMFINQWRGMHSSGFVCVDKNAGYSYVKDLGGATRLWVREDWAEMKAQVFKHGRFTYGHGRFATRGNITVENAHPFIVGEKEHEIVLVHNGTLEGHQTVPDFHADDVDSRWMAKAIQEHGSDVLGFINGAIATIWYDFAKKKMFVFRNDQRPLFWARYNTKWCPRIIINSEREALMWVKLKYRLDFEEKDIQPFVAMNLYEFDVENFGGEFKRSVITKRWNWQKRHEKDDWPKSYNAPARGPGVPQIPFNRPAHPTMQGEKVVALDVGVAARSYEIDSIRILNGEYHRVEFNKLESGFVKRWTRMKNETLEVAVIAAPYRADLAAISRGGENIVLYEYHGPNNTKQHITKTYTARELEAMAATARAQAGISETQSPEAEGTPGPKGKRGPGRPTGLKWRTKVGHLEIKNRGLSTASSIEYLTEYENQHDGQLKLGDVVCFDLEDVERLPVAGVQGMDTFRCWGKRIKDAREPDDKAIDVMFQKTKWSEEELYRIGQFSGKIAFIKMNRPDDRKTGAAVIISLTDVKPLSEAISVH